VSATSTATAVPIARKAPFDLQKAVLQAYSIGVYVFLYAPIVVLILFSFNAAEQTATWGGVTTRWYETLWKDDAVFAAGWNSLRVATLTTLLSTILGTAAALGLRSASKRLMAFAQPLRLLPIVLPEIVMAVALLGLFGSLKIELDFFTVWAAHVVFSTSYVVVVVRARLAGMDTTLEEAAADLGATPWVTFWKVTLPQLWPAVVAGALLVVTLSIDDYLITSFVAGVGNTTLPLQIYAMVRKKVTPEINAICTLLIALTTTLVAVAYFLERRTSDRR
jgi:spermidine/putrescine transport system permease protein